MKNNKQNFISETTAQYTEYYIENQEGCSATDLSNYKLSESKKDIEAISTLEDSIPYMKSTNYKERFRAEYWQNKIRYERLKNFCTEIEASLYSEAVLKPKYDCPYELLREQQRAMGEYLHILELRAKIENIIL